MACRSDDRLASLTLLAAQTDFTEPGELALFIDHSQMHFLASMMWNRGYLSADQMAGAFQLLRSNDLVWSRRVREYLMGERTPMIDLMAWNADSTRMPYRMRTEYLQRLYLDNALAAGRFPVDGRPAALQNIRVPVFAVGTERDHVAPWRSVYKIHNLAGADVTFVLTSGGHNAGIVSEPSRPNRRYRVAVKRTDDLCQGADEWTRNAEARHGSWWEAWVEWLAAHSGAKRVAPPAVMVAAAHSTIISELSGDRRGEHLIACTCRLPGRHRGSCVGERVQRIHRGLGRGSSDRREAACFSRRRIRAAPWPLPPAVSVSPARIACPR